MELIVVKNKELGDPDQGILDIVFTRDIDTREISEPSIEEFPNLGIWISKNYAEIDSKYKNGELFLLHTYYELSPEDIEDSVNSNYHHHHHWSKGDHTSALEVGEFMPVIEADLPEISSGLLQVNSLPNGIFFIENDDSIYGPFNATSTDNGIIASPYATLKLSLKTSHILKLNISELEENNIYLKSSKSTYTLPTKKYVSSLKRLSGETRAHAEELDYIDDAQLITYFSKNKFGKKKGLISRKEAETLKQAVRESIKHKQLLKSDERVARLTKNLDEYLTTSDVGVDVIDSYLSNTNGKAFLKELIESKPALIKSHLGDFDKKKSIYEGELKDLEIKRISASTELINIGKKVENATILAQKEIDNIKEQTKEQAGIERKKVSAEIEEEIAQKQADKEKVISDYETAFRRLKKIESYSEIDEAKNYAEKRHDELSQLIRAQENKLKNPELPKEVTELKTLLDLLQGRVFERKEVKAKYSSPKITSFENISAEVVIESLTSSFEEAGRSFSYDEMANLLICNQQSFLTILKGLPGSGKTSTAIRLAHSHNLIENEESISDNFLNIPVSRGWVSGRDFLGFYNSMKGIYQPAKTGMYQFLTQSKEEKSGRTLRIVLLDEANLSPIEHYWSDFLGMCDIEGRSRNIDTGMGSSERYLKAAENIRFIATINNDSTTESLSPRLLDRAPVISLDFNQASVAREISSQSIDGAIEYSDLENFFGRMELITDEPLGLTSFYDIMEEKGLALGMPIVISKRKRIAMHSYYERAITFMDPKLAEDFALSQYALPLISGYGKTFKERLSRLLEQASNNNYARTVALLETIILDGDSHVGSYSFF